MTPQSHSFGQINRPLVRSVWSFWTKPWRENFGWGWSSEKHHLLAWILSFETARKHYPKTSLVTDDAGAKLLVDGIGLEFDSVSTELNVLAAHDPTFWMMGKLYAYRAQTEPFVHLDTDVFLWKRLPTTLETAPVFTQNPEPFVISASHYKPEQMQFLMSHQTQGWIPQEWEWSLSFGSPQRGECCGIMGGNFISFIRHYADSAIKMIEDPRNEAGWLATPDKGKYGITIEQYHLAACVDYHRNRPDSPYREIEMRYLFDSLEQALNPNMTATLGFTHLWSDVKQNIMIAERVEKRVRNDYPDHYEKCVNYVRRLGASSAIQVKKKNRLASSKPSNPRALLLNVGFRAP